MKNLPAATYRLQFNKEFNFGSALKLLPYLQELGITHIYASPIFKASKESPHGYDVVDPTRLNPELGTEDEFDNLILRAGEMGIFWLQDIVPNHMAFDFENKMLVDLLENGPDSRFYNYFDVEWSSGHFGNKPQMLAPFLGRYYHETLEEGEISLGYDEEGFSINYFDKKFPVRVGSYYDILSLEFNKLMNKVGRNYHAVIKLLGLLHIIRFLPNFENVEERYNQITFIKALLWELYSDDELVRMYINQTLKIYNGVKDKPDSYDLLDNLLSDQYFRLSYWKVANEEINYRRFFNISGLISLKIENEEVFNRTHSLIFKLIKVGKIYGLRIDHIDGLYNPGEYLHRLREKVDGKYLIVEKILAEDEMLPKSWPVDGTTGYDFLNLVNGVFCRSANENKMSRIYTQFARKAISFDDLVVEKKRLIINTRMAGELERLSLLVEDIAKHDRKGADITLIGIKSSLEEILVHFPVYRTYVSGNNITDTDKDYICRTVGILKYEKPRLEHEIDYIGKLLTLQHNSTSNEIYLKTTDFIMKFQQLTGPLMAKGLEDTALYVYNRLISLNDVGGNPSRFGYTLKDFHKRIKNRGVKWRYSLNATSTHDTKRGEDVRAWINVLSEIPDEWNSRVRKWHNMNLRYKREFGGRFYPNRNDEYFFYQTLVGAIPFGDTPGKEVKQRIKDYLIKVVREAKVFTAWVKPDENYESAFLQFIDKVLSLSERNHFLEDFKEFSKYVSFFGVFNSLSQTLIKMTAPGIPDFYQGSELWDFNLVDPDNRKPVDFPFRRKLLGLINQYEAGQETLFRYLYANLNNGAVKMFLIKKVLGIRRKHHPLFEEGSYIPVSSSGEYGRHIISFIRRYENTFALIAVPRFLTGIVEYNKLPLGEGVWKNTCIKLPFDTFCMRNELTHETLTANEITSRSLFNQFPCALFTGEVKG